MTSLTREPKLFVVAGCLRGITALMVNFPKTMEEGLCAVLYFILIRLIINKLLLTIIRLRLLHVLRLRFGGALFYI